MQDAPKEITVEHDELISTILHHNKLETERKSEAGETAAELKEFLEETGVNSKAMAWMRSILKQKKEANSLDIIRSLEHILPMVAAHVRGQSTIEMDLGEDEPDEFSGEADDDDFGGDFDDEADEETQAFNAAVDEADDDDDNVIPLGGDAA